MNCEKPLMLVLDNGLLDPSEWFGDFFHVITIGTLNAAEKVLRQYKIDIFLMDVKNEEELILGSRCKIRFPKTMVCIWTSEMQRIHQKLYGGILCVQRTEKNLVAPMILNQWLLEKQETWKKIRRMRVAQKLCSNSVKVYFREPNKELEALHMCSAEDPKKTFMAIACRHPDRLNQLNLYLTIMMGCPAGCLMCGTGRIHTIRKLLIKEIAGQVPHLLESYKSFGHSPCDKISIGYPNGGDPIYCMHELCGAIEMIDENCNLKARHTVTSIGNKKTFQYLFQFLSDHDVSYHLSGHSTDEKKREWLMPATKGQSLEELIDVCCEHNAKTGQRFTYNHMLIKGFNDSLQEVDRIASLLEKTPFDVNVMTISDGGLEKYPQKITAQDALNFVEELRWRDVKAKYRENLGKGMVKCGRHITARDRHFENID